MITAILTFLLGGGLVSVLVDGAKQLSVRYAAASAVWKHVLVWGLAVAFVLVMRGFDLPGSLLGWTYFLGSIAVVALVAQGWFRMRQQKYGVTVLNESLVAPAKIRPSRAKPRPSVDGDVARRPLADLSKDAPETRPPLPEPGHVRPPSGPHS